MYLESTQALQRGDGHQYFLCMAAHSHCCVWDADWPSVWVWEVGSSDHCRQCFTGIVGSQLLPCFWIQGVIYPSASRRTISYGALARAHSVRFGLKTISHILHYLLCLLKAFYIGPYHAQYCAVPMQNHQSSVCIAQLGGSTVLYHSWNQFSNSFCQPSSLCSRSNLDWLPHS